MLPGLLDLLLDLAVLVALLLILVALVLAGLFFSVSVFSGCLTSAARFGVLVRLVIVVVDLIDLVGLAEVLAMLDLGVGDPFDLVEAAPAFAFLAASKVSLVREELVERAGMADDKVFFLKVSIILSKAPKLF